MPPDVVARGYRWQWVWCLRSASAESMPARGRWLIVLLLAVASVHPAGTQTVPTEARLLTDFTSSSADLEWYVVNDTVMGGRSEGGFELGPEGLRFTGRTNTNGGGFSSIRTRAVDLDLSGYEGIRLRLRGDGRRYTWRLTTDSRWRGRVIGYWAEFETRTDGWTDVDIPFARFRPTFRGRELEGPALDPARVSGMGLMIYDGRDGDFDMHLRRIEVFPPSPDSLAGIWHGT